MQIDKAFTNLCDTCTVSMNVPECIPGHDVEFGTGKGYYNIIKCSNYKKYDEEDIDEIV